MGRYDYHLISQDIDSSNKIFHERVEDPVIYEQYLHNIRNTTDIYQYRLIACICHN